MTDDERAEIREEAVRFSGCEPGTDDCDVAEVLLASVAVDPNIARIAKAIRMPRHRVAQFSRNFRAGGVWKCGKVIHSGWDDPVEGS